MNGFVFFVVVDSHYFRYKYANLPDLQAAKQDGRLFSDLKWPTEQEVCWLSVS
jgi:hypothetical protein